ncbi:hypothetical protein SAMN06265220_10734 [Flavobacterium nitrogenifigens]|uniref:Uncharacterized protein n=1 Tax=Flavobacterium nitrogenifigens TaxID=1617283 RepID=A0A521F9E6_9FLAO|nr:hypothetical protein SAMN06265220_10734 [Flavobacterium nitrogenifigens]
MRINCWKLTSWILRPSIHIRFSFLKSWSTLARVSFTVPTILARSPLERVIKTFFWPSSVLYLSCRINRLSATRSLTVRCDKTAIRFATTLNSWLRHFKSRRENTAELLRILKKSSLDINEMTEFSMATALSPYAFSLSMAV